MIHFDTEEDIIYFIYREYVDSFIIQLKEKGMYKEVCVKAKKGDGFSLVTEKDWDIFDGGSIIIDNLRLSMLRRKQLIKLAELCEFSLPSYEYDVYSLLKEKIQVVKDG
jgi:hypothetical protein